MEQTKMKDMISQMTLEEKAGLCSGLDFWHTKGIERLGIPSESWEKHWGKNARQKTSAPFLARR